MDWTNKQQVKEYHKEYYYKRRQELTDYLGGSCVICGSSKDLHFDHVDPSKKSFNIKDNLSISNPKVRAELDKCQLLCEKHHHEKTSKENEGFTHGTVYAWMKKRCRCDICKPEWRKWHNERNKKRRK